jgi:hypothetical protein
MAASLPWAEEEARKCEPRGTTLSHCLLLARQHVRTPGRQIKMMHVRIYGARLTLLACFHIYRLVYVHLASSIADRAGKRITLAHPDRWP